MKSIGSSSSIHGRGTERGIEQKRGFHLGASGASRNCEDKVEMSFDHILTWHKLETKGPVEPLARIGHTSCLIQNRMYIFGGIIAGKRSNLLSILDLKTKKWEDITFGKLKSQGQSQADIPSGRSHHVAWVMDDRYMIIQGGETNGPCMDVGYRWLLEDGSESLSDNGKLREQRKAKLIPNGIVEIDDNLINVSTVNSNDEQNRYEYLKPKRKNIQIGKEMPPVCTNDLYVYDTYTFEWKKLETKLTPMPRRGHTVCVVNDKSRIVSPEEIKEDSKIDTRGASENKLTCKKKKVQQQPQMVIMFGGYQPGLGFSDALLDKKMDYDQRQHIKNKGFLNEVWSISLDDAFLQGKGVWRKCFTDGVVPSPRYGHTLNLVEKLKQKGTINTKIAFQDSEKKERRKEFDESNSNKSNVQEKQVSKKHNGNNDNLSSSFPSSSPSSPSSPSSSSSSSAPEYECLQQLFVFGGIGPNGNLYNDVHFLDLQTMTWNKIFKPAGKPPPPRYHHTACVIDAPTLKLMGNDSKSKSNLSSSASKFVRELRGRKKDRPCSSSGSNDSQGKGLLIYGGSMHVGENSPNAKPIYSHELYFLDFKTMRFQSVNTGHAFPNSRSNHSLCILQNYQSSPMRANGTLLDEISTKKEEKKELLDGIQIKCRTFAVIYGGLNNMYVNPDTWILQLKWRKHKNKLDESETNPADSFSSDDEDGDESEYEFDDEGNRVKKGCVTIKKFHALKKGAALLERQLLKETTERLEQEERSQLLEEEITVLKQNLDEANQKTKKIGASLTKRAKALIQKNKDLENLVKDLQQLLLISETDSILLSNTISTTDNKIDSIASSNYNEDEDKSSSSFSKDQESLVVSKKSLDQNGNLAEDYQSNDSIASTDTETGEKILTFDQNTVNMESSFKDRMTENEKIINDKDKM